MSESEYEKIERAKRIVLEWVSHVGDDQFWAEVALIDAEFEGVDSREADLLVVESLTALGRRIGERNGNADRNI